MKFVILALISTMFLGCVPDELVAESGGTTKECDGFTIGGACCAYCSDVLGGKASADQLCEETLAKYYWDALVREGCDACNNSCELFLCANKSADPNKPDTASACFSCVSKNEKANQSFLSCENNKAQ